MSILKRIAAQYLPKPILLWIKAIYYTREAPKFWEPDVEPLKCLIRPGDIVMDLGANTGEYTFILANLTGDRGRVYAVEPVPETFQILSEVVRKLGLRNVELFNCAVSETDGSVRMEIPLHQYGGKNFYMARIVSKQLSPNSLASFEVSCRSLDSLLLNRFMETVSFVKCDVEGHELAVLKGASQFFERNRPAMMIEVVGTAEVQDAPNNEFFLIMKGYGYKPYWFDGKNLRERTRGHWSVNYFFLQPSHIAEVSHLLVK
jgi:FkbM family methyltransferase